MSRCVRSLARSRTALLPPALFLQGSNNSRSEPSEWMAESRSQRLWNTWLLAGGFETRNQTHGARDKQLL